MNKEKKTRTVKLEKHDPDTCPMIVGKVKTEIRAVKSKQKIKVATSNSNSTSAKVTSWETTGNIMRLCVNLMPVLAAVKEPVEEEEEEEEDNICTSKKEQETSSKNDPSVMKPEEQTLDSSKGLNLDSKPALNPWLVLPPISQSEAAPAAGCDRQKRSHTPRPPISLSENSKSISSSVSIKGSRGNEVAAGQGADYRPWIDYPVFSKSRSPEFRLPDVSLSSLDALLQTVTQKLARRKRRGGDEELWRRVQSDHLLMGVSEHRLRAKSVTENRNLANSEAVPEASVGGCSVNRQRSVPPLSPASKPALILTMMKNNLWTSNTLQ